MSVLSTVLITTGIFIGLGSPGPIREILALFLALILPEAIVNPMNIVTRIVFPPIVIFEDYMAKYERIRTILPRFIAAEVILVILGAILVIIGTQI